MNRLATVGGLSVVHDGGRNMTSGDERGNLPVFPACGLVFCYSNFLPSGKTM